MWHCWICEKKGRSVSSLLKCLGVNIEVKVSSKNNKQEENLELFSLSFPDDYMPVCNLTEGSTYYKRCFTYLNKRDISFNDALKYKIGVSFSGSFTNRLIFPSFDKDGILNFYTGRTIDGHFLKYFVPKTPKNYKNTIVLNELNIDWDKPLLIVEGFIDMMKTGMTNVVPLFGSTMNKHSKLYSLISQNQCDVYLALDKDAQEKQISIAQSLLAAGVEVFIVDIGNEYEDIGSMPVGAFMGCYNKAKQITENDLLKQKIQERMK